MVPRVTVTLDCYQNNSRVTQNEICASSKLNWSEERDERQETVRKDVRVFKVPTLPFP